MPVSGTRRTDPSPLGIVRATVLLPEPSPSTLVVLKGRTSGFYQEDCSEGSLKLKGKKKYFKYVYKTKTNLAPNHNPQTKQTQQSTHTRRKSHPTKQRHFKFPVVCGITEKRGSIICSNVLIGFEKNFQQEKKRIIGLLGEFSLSPGNTGKRYTRAFNVVLGNKFRRRSSLPHRGTRGWSGEV